MKIGTDELMIIGILDESKIDASINLKELQRVFYNVLQLGPMFLTFVNHVEKLKSISIELNRLDEYVI